MWIDYFNYRYCIISDTLFLQGVDEDNMDITAYSLPIGALPLSESIEMLRRHCLAAGEQLRFSAIPEDMLHLFVETGPSAVEELHNWSDYLYDASALATLAGNKLKRKRNHVNRFLADNPNAVFSPMTEADIHDCKALLTKLSEADRQEDISITASVERTQVFEVLNAWAGTYSRYMTGACLRDNSGSLVAFTIGEIIGDTLFVHIEKMDHCVPGAGETINKMFAEYITSQHPQVLYINREEDVGDEGLRAAKLSYRPIRLLPKFNVIF